MNVTGIAKSAIALQTQSAHCRPPLSAAVGVAPSRLRTFTCAAVIVDAIAPPIAPPSCCEVLSRPEARPASRSATPARAAIETGMKANAVPSPVTKNGPRRLLQYAPYQPGSPEEADPISAMPAAITSFGEPRVTSICERPANATEGTDVASHANPVCSAE